MLEYDIRKDYNLVDWSDYKFAKYLNKKKWSWTSTGNSNRFYDENNLLIAVVIYDNAECKRKIYIPK